jgi:hypothetical protein
LKAEGEGTVAEHEQVSASVRRLLGEQERAENIKKRMST